MREMSGSEQSPGARPQLSRQAAGLVFPGSMRALSDRMNLGRDFARGLQSATPTLNDGVPALYVQMQGAGIKHGIVTPIPVGMRRVEKVLAK